MSIATKQYAIPRPKLIERLERMAARPPALTFYIKQGAAEKEARETLLSALDSGSLVDELAKRAGLSTTGAAVFYGGGMAQLILPPFRIESSLWGKNYYPAPLRDLLEKERTIGLVLVRLGHFAAAVYSGEKLLDYKAGTGLVHARHRQGGSSANRFARHREKQVEYFFTRVEKHSREVLEGRLRDLECVFYGGTKETVQLLCRQCAFFTRLEPLVMPRLLDVREPKFSTLPEALELACQSTVFEFRE